MSQKSMFGKIISGVASKDAEILMVVGVIATILFFIGVSGNLSINVQKRNLSKNLAPAITPEPEQASIIVHDLGEIEKGRKKYTNMLIIGGALMAITFLITMQRVRAYSKANK